MTVIVPPSACPISTRSANMPGGAEPWTCCASTSACPEAGSVYVIRNTTRCPANSDRFTATVMVGFGEELDGPDAGRGGRNVHSHARRTAALSGADAPVERGAWAVIGGTDVDVSPSGAVANVAEVLVVAVDTGPPAARLLCRSPVGSRLATSTTTSARDADITMDARCRRPQSSTRP